MTNPYRHVHLEGETAGHYLGLASNWLAGLRRVGAQFGLTALSKQVQVSETVRVQVRYCGPHDFLNIYVADGDQYFILGDEAGVYGVYATDRLTTGFHKAGTVGLSLALENLRVIGRHQATAMKLAANYASAELYRTSNAGLAFTDLGTFTCQYPVNYAGTGYVARLLTLGLKAGTPALYWAAGQQASDGHYYPFGLLSLDAGATWSEVDLPRLVGIDHAPPAVANLDTTRLVGFQACATGTTLPVALVSDDSGQTWTATAMDAVWQALPAPQQSLFSAAMAFCGVATFAYAGSDHVVALGVWNNAAQCLLSADRGATWRAGPVLAQGSDWGGGVVQGNLVALCDGVLLYLAPTATYNTAKVWLSTDYGATWSVRTDITLASGGRIGYVTVIRPQVTSNGVISQYAELALPVWDTSAYRLWRSTDSGTTWSAAAQVPTTAAAPDPGNAMLPRFAVLSRLGTPARPAKLDYVFPNNCDDRLAPV